MIYALTVAIIAIFLMLFAAFKPKLREEYAVRIADFADFKAKSQEYIKSFPLPKQNGSKLYVEHYVSSIKSSLRTLSKRKNKEYFQSVLSYSAQIKQFAKQKFDSMTTLPSIDGAPRVVKLAEFLMKSCDYEYNGERIAAILNIQNSHKTLSFDEILALNSAFMFVLLKKIAFLLNDVKIICKMKHIADKNAKTPYLIKDEKTYSQLKNSKIFLSFCDSKGLYNSEECVSARNEHISSVQNAICAVLQTKHKIEETDFTAFYTPLQIFCKYEAFDSAGDEEKCAFLKLVKKLSDDENIDEFLYAIRVDNYLKSAVSAHIKVFRVGVFGRKISSIYVKQGLSTLAAGLSSKALMTLLFGGMNSNKANKTTLKTSIFENTFENIGRFQNVNLGISLQNGKLKLNPRLPAYIVRADISVEHGGIIHNIHLQRGSEREVYLGNTKVSGVSVFKLTNKPLDITYILSNGD